MPDRLSLPSASRVLADLVERIARALGQRHVLVTRLAPGRTDALQTLAAWLDGRPAPCFDYELDGTPCARVIAEGVLLVPHGVQTAYPRDVCLVALHAESFAGVALRGSDGAVLGHLCALDTAPCAEPERLLETLRLHAERAAAVLERQEAEDALRSTNQRLQALTDHLPGMVYTVRVAAGGRQELEFLNERGLQLLGEQAAGLLRESLTSFLDWMHPEDRARLRGGVLLEPRSHEPVDREFRLRSAKGRWRWFRSISQPVAGEDGEVRWHGLLLDVDARHRAEEEAAAGRALLQTVIESIPDPVQCKDGAGRWQVANSAALALCGLENVAWCGLADENLPARAPAAAAMLQALGASDEETWQAGCRVDRVVEVMQEPGQPPRTFEVTKVPLFQADGSRRGLVASLREVTARLRAERTRREIERQLHLSRKMEALGQLAGGIAHDFDNLLTVVLGYVELARPRLAEAGPAAPMLGQALDQIERAANQAAGLTRKLLAYGRRDGAAPGPRDAAHILAESRGLFERLLGEHILLQTEVREPLPAVVAGEGQLEQILLNLAVNGRDAMPRGGRLRIALEGVEVAESPAEAHPVLAPGSYLLVEVADEGVGISPDAIDRILEPFYTTKELGRGSGLGLATVYGIVTLLGGGLAVRSRLGAGTTFQVWLPAAAEPAPPPSPAPDGSGATPEIPPPLPGDWTILLCEDEDTVRQLARRVLEAAGFRVVATRNAAEAEEWAAAPAAHCDLLLTDVMMPGKNGPELVRALRERQPGLPVIYMSGYPADLLAAQHVAPDQVDLLQKPFRCTDLLQRVRNSLAALPSGPASL